MHSPSAPLIDSSTVAASAAPWPRMAFIGAGRIAQVLAPALQRLGCPVAAVASRSEVSARHLAGLLGEAATGADQGAAQDSAGAERLAATQAHAATLVCDAQTAVDRAELVWLTVVDDAIAPTAAALRWRPGQAVVHCSGATELAALQAAAEQGAAVAGFHPLQIFSDPALAARRLAGSSVAIEAAGPTELLLTRIAEGLGLAVLRLPPGSRALYHAGAAYAASYLLAALDEAAAVWRTLGIDEAAALRALLPLAHLTLDAAGQRGLAQAQAGPIARGDAGVVRRQIDALAELGEPHAAFYRELGRRQLALAERAGRLDDAALARLAAALGEQGLG